MSRTQLPFFILLLGSAVVVVVVIGGIGNPFRNSSFVNFRDPVPQPNISLIEVEVSVQRDLCDLADILHYISEDAYARFKLVNSGEEDGFAIVELTARDVIVNSNRYFVRADETQHHVLSFEDLSCSITEEEIDVRVASVEGP